MNKRVVVLSSALCLALSLLSSCEPTGSSPERHSEPERTRQVSPSQSVAPTAFDEATKRIMVLDSANPQWAFGNVPRAEEMAAQFNALITAMQRISFTGGDDNAFSLTDGEFSTHCELRENQVSFLVHVPQMKNYRDEARQALLEIAWASAAQVTEPKCSNCRIGVGLRGDLFYGAIATGNRLTRPRMEMGTVLSPDALYDFFTGPLADVTTNAATAEPVDTRVAELTDELNRLEKEDRRLPETIAKLDELHELDRDVSVAGPRLLELLKTSPSPGTRGAALRLLAKSEGEAMIPTLEWALRDIPWRNVMDDAVRALLRMGPRGRAVLERHYRESPHTQMSIVATITSEDIDYEPLLPLLRVSATDANFRIVAMSFEVLAAMHDSESIPIMIAALETGTVQKREAAARALQGFGPEAKDAVPVLIELVENETRRPLLTEVTKALQSIGPEAADAIPVLQEKADATPWLRTLVDDAIAAIEDGGGQDQ